MKKLLLSVLTIACGLTGTLRAQSAEYALPAYGENIWSLEECMRYAVANSPSVVRRKLNNANAKADYQQAILDHLPSLSGSTGINSNFGRNADPETNIYTNSNTMSNNYSLSASFTIFNGLSLINSTRIAKIMKLRGDELLQQTEDNVALETMTAYFDLSYSLGSLTLAREQVEEARNTLAQTRRMLSLGMKSAADVAQLEADLANYEYLLTRAENQVRTNELTLKDKMNYPLDEPLAVDTAARYTVPLPETTDPDEIVRFAIASLPQSEMAQMDIRMAQLRLSSYKASLFPSIGASASLSSGYSTLIGAQSSPFRDQLKDKYSKGFGISMSVPIFNAWSRPFNIIRGRNNVRIAEQDQLEAVRQIAVEVEQAILDLNGALMEREQAVKQVAAREISYRVADRKYKEGLLSALDLQTIANQLLSARSTLLSAELTWQAKRKLVDYYKGIPLLSDY